MNNDENADELKDDQLMDDAEKVDSEKIKEEKVDIEQAGDDKAEDDQVGALVSMIQNEKPEVPSSSSTLSLPSNYAPLLDVLIFVIPEQTTSTPLTTPLPTPPISSEAPTITTTVPDPLLMVLQRLSNLERKLESWIKVDHSKVIEESVQANIINEKNPAFPAQSSFTPAQPASGAAKDVNPDKVPRKRDCRNDQDPTVGSNQGKQKRRKGKDSEPSKDKFKLVHPLKLKLDPSPHLLRSLQSYLVQATPRPPILDPEWNQDKTAADRPEQTWFNDRVHVKKPLLTFDDLMSTPIDVTGFTMNRLKIDKHTKADLVGHVYKLLKGTYKSDRCPYDLSKPLPLHGSPCYLTIPSDFFFNNDLEYLKTSNKERKYTSPVKVAYDKDAALGISHWEPKRQLFYRSHISKQSKHEVYSTMKILSMVSVKVDKRFGYGYLKDIIMRRVDQKLYTFKEHDFPKLYLNDIEDMLLLHVQNNLFNLEGDEIVDLAIALRMFTRRIVIL
nr:hypothetical protein [Tanacetum cinerariifolium]